MTVQNAIVTVEISVGELIDKLTILEIKRETICEPEKRANVEREWRVLSDATPQNLLDDDRIAGLRAALKQVNAELWRIEDQIRDKERVKIFDAEFIALARSVYVLNDRRAALKREINLLSGSRLVEEKSYRPY